MKNKTIKLLVFVNLIFLKSKKSQNKYIYIYSNH